MLYIMIELQYGTYLIEIKGIDVHFLHYFVVLRTLTTVLLL